MNRKFYFYVLKKKKKNNLQTFKCVNDSCTYWDFCCQGNERSSGSSSDTAVTGVLTFDAVSHFVDCDFNVVPFKVIVSDCS